MTRDNKEKTEGFAEQLAKICKANNNQSDTETEEDINRELVTPKDAAEETKGNLNPKKPWI